MADLGVLAHLSDILSTRNTLVAIASIMVVGLWRGWTGLPAVMAAWNERLRDKVSERATDWTRLRDEIARLDTRCKNLEEAEQRCRSELADKERRLAALEGYEIGRGKADNEAAAIVAKDRAEEAIKKERGQK